MTSNPSTAQDRRLVALLRRPAKAKNNNKSISKLGQTMVRHKTRWLLVQLESPTSVPFYGGLDVASHGEGDIILRGDSEIASKREFSGVIRGIISSHFGIAAEDFTSRTQGESVLWHKSDFEISFQIDWYSFFHPSLTRIPNLLPSISVRVYDPATGLALLRVPREFAELVRSSLTLTLWSRNSLNTGISTSKKPVLVASTLAINGSARTAKLATISELQRVYSARLRSYNSDKQSHLRELQRFRALLTDIQCID